MAVPLANDTTIMVPFRQIRAHWYYLPFLCTLETCRLPGTIAWKASKRLTTLYLQDDKDTITVYQAYSEQIASAAVEQQRLSASPAFLPARMTWIKPSWAWMMYRSGYSYKDKNQARLLALRLKHDDFHNILRQAIVTNNHGKLKEDEKLKLVRVQWDPERDIRLGVLPYRSIQIGLKGEASEKLADMIVGIEDVTMKARDLKEALDEASLSHDKLEQLGLVPHESAYALPEDLIDILKMEN
ncbi:hypothetical protein GGR57DRAFT_496755 [Xylariaceae sp. FL1272]|nr:hypothetical protein GGR57DRAFT_496755 [Xylariaceae sp. FL1272]